MERCRAMYLSLNNLSCAANIIGTFLHVTSLSVREARVHRRRQLSNLLIVLREQRLLRVTNVHKPAAFSFALRQLVAQPRALAFLLLETLAKVLN